MKRIKKGDKVIVLIGKSKGHIGEVKKVAEQKIWVEGANLVKKHEKPNPNIEKKGGIVNIEAPIHVSNVALYNESTQKAEKVGFKEIDKDGKPYKVRYYKKSGDVVEQV